MVDLGQKGELSSSPFSFLIPTEVVIFSNRNHILTQKKIRISKRFGFYI